MKPKEELNISLANRANAGKLRWSLVDFRSIEATLRVLEFGADKYGANNWKRGHHRDELLESLMRHLVRLFEGEEIDLESGLPHIDHIACNVMFYQHGLRNDSFSLVRRNPFKYEDIREEK